MEEQKDNVEDIIRRRRQEREAEEQAAIEQQQKRNKQLAVAPRDQVEPQEHIMQFFKYEHLPEILAAISKPFCNLAVSIVNNLPRNPERTVALRKLLEAKDAAVRAFVSGR